MKSIFYAVAAIVVLFFAVRLMSKVKDFPKEEPEQFEDEDGVADDDDEDDEEDDDEDDEEEDGQNVTS